MGPNVLWLVESLTQVMDLQPGVRVLDMGCEKAVSSIFLAKELGVKVWANDLYLGYFASFVKTGGLIGNVVPGIQAE